MRVRRRAQASAAQACWSLGQGAGPALNWQKLAPHIASGTTTHHTPYPRHNHATPTALLPPHHSPRVGVHHRLDTLLWLHHRQRLAGCCARALHHKPKVHVLRRGQPPVTHAVDHLRATCRGLGLVRWG